MNALIPETQTAFLPGRQSAENIWIHQAVPPLLVKEGNWALMVLCDFQKPYGAINRRFLYKILYPFESLSIHLFGFLILHIEALLSHSRNGDLGLSPLPVLSGKRHLLPLDPV
jgi:hypothetical protein